MITPPGLHDSIQGSYLFFRLRCVCLVKVFLSVPVRCPRDRRFSFGAAMTAGVQWMQRLSRIKVYALGGGGGGGTRDMLPIHAWAW